jgi:DNA-binding winged helix-turn-helix (wHTH) protein/tetratricopeptide (TPR) repeat protein
LETPRITFGPFVISASPRILLCKDTVVPVSPKPLALLAILAKAQGRVVPKSELLKTVWPDTFVEDANLTQNISVLRKLLSDEYPGKSPIETIAKVGYRFREPVLIEQEVSASLVAAEGTSASDVSAPDVSDATFSIPADAAAQSLSSGSSLNRQRRRTLTALLTSALIVGSAAFAIMIQRHIQADVRARKTASNLIEPRGTVSSNPEANRLYVEGMKLSQAFDGRGAADRLQRAVALDPNFALAHLELSGALTILGEQNRAIEEAQKAESLSASLPREQQLVIRARAAAAENRYDDAAATYRSLYTFAPDNTGYAMLMAANLSYAGHPRQALDSLQPILATDKTGTLDPRLYSVVADCYSLLGDWTSTLAWASKGVDESKRRGDTVLYGRMLTTRTQALFFTHQYDEALAETQQALEIARRFSDLSGELRALNRLAQIETALKKLPEARSMLEQALDLEERSGQVERKLQTLSSLGVVMQDLGHPSEARALFQQELATARDINQPDFVVKARLDLAREQILDGDLYGGQASLRRIVSDATRLNDAELQLEATKELRAARSSDMNRSRLRQ